MNIIDALLWTFAFVVGVSLFGSIIFLCYLIYRFMETSCEAYVVFLDMFGKWWTR